MVKAYNSRVVILPVRMVFAFLYRTGYIESDRESLQRFSVKIKGGNKEAAQWHNQTRGVLLVLFVCLFGRENGYKRDSQSIFKEVCRVWDDYHKHLDYGGGNLFFQVSQQFCIWRSNWFFYGFCKDDRMVCRWFYVFCQYRTFDCGIYVSWNGCGSEDGVCKYADVLQSFRIGAFLPAFWTFDKRAVAGIDICHILSWIWLGSIV